MNPITVLFAAPVRAELATAGAGAPPRTITGLAVPFGVPSAPSYLDGIRYQFTGPPANPDDLLDLVRGHDDDAVVGRLAAPLAEAEGGLSATARVFGTTAGNDVLVEAAEGVLTGFSVSAEVTEYTTDPATEVRTVTAWAARHLGVVRRPAFDQSRGLNVAASAQLGDTVPAPAAPTTTTAPPAGAEVAPLPTVAELATQVSDAIRAELAAAGTANRHPLAQFATEADYFHAIAAAEPDEAARLQAAFAVPDQITTDNTALLQPAWRSTILMVLDDRRPAIRAMGAIGLPASGMESKWPYFDGDITAIIQAQAAEKTDLAGIKISIKPGSAPIKTAGTVSDISYQLLLRSDPSYLSAYLTICRAAWAAYTEAVFEAALVAAGTAAATAPPLTVAADFAAWLFEQSSAVRTATGAPADVVGAAPDAFAALGKLSAGFVNPSYGTQNVQGTASAATLRVNVNGLEVVEWPYLPAGNVVVAGSSAAKFAEQGPLIASTEDVRKLGRDVAVWGMYEDAEVYWPAGVIVGKPVAGP